MAERWLTDLADLVDAAEADGIPVFVGRARRHRGAHRVPPAPRGAGRRCSARCCRAWPRCSTAPGGCSCSRTSSTTPTSGAVFRSARGPGRGCRARHPPLRGPALPPLDPGVDGHRVPGAVDADRPVARGSGAAARAGLHRGRAGARRTTRSRSTSWPPTRPSGSPWCWAPRATGCPGAPSRRGRPHRAHPDGRWRRLAQRRGRRRRRGVGAARAGLSRRAHRRLGHPCQRQEHPGVRPRRSPCAGSPSCPTPSSWSTTTSSRPGAASFVRPARRRRRTARRAARGGRRGGRAWPGRPPGLPRGPGRARQVLGRGATRWRGCGRRRPRRWPTSTCSSCSRSTRTSGSRCRTTRTRSCAPRWTSGCSTCATTTSWSGGAAGAGGRRLRRSRAWRRCWPSVAAGRAR